MSLNVVDHARRFVDANVGVETNPIAGRSAKKPVDRLTVDLAGDVPARLIQRGKRRGQYHAAFPEAEPKEALPVVLDPGWVFADECRANFVDGGFDGALPPFDG